MRKILCCVLFILLLPTIAAAQEANPPAWTENSWTLFYSGVSNIIVMGNTINDNFTLFYRPNPEPKKLYSRTISSDGSKEGQEYLIGDNILALRYCSIVWHPVTKRFLLLIKDDDKIYAVAANANGKRITSKKLIATGVDEDFPSSPAVAWTSKKKFMVFYRKNNQIWAQKVRKGAGKVKAPQQLTSFASGFAYPCSTSTEEDGTAVCYYATGYDAYDPNNKFKPYMIRVDIGLNTLGNHRLASNQKTTWLYNYPGAYDPDTQTHAIVIGNRFALFNKQGRVATPAGKKFTTIPGAGGLSNLTYNSKDKEFGGYYRRAWADESTYTEYTYLHYATFDSNGTVKETDFEFGGSTDEADGITANINRDGDRLGLISWEGYGGSGPTWAMLYYR